MKLSKEEKELILKHRKQEEDKLPKKEGFAKENLYQLNDFEMHNWFASESEKEKIIKDFQEKYIELAVPAGSRFVCYIEHDQEAWYDDTESGLFGAMTESWAKKYLKNIRTIKNKK